MATHDASHVQISGRAVTLRATSDDSRQASIAAALQEYRTTVQNHNLAMFRILVDGMAKQSDEHVIEEERDLLRLQPFKEEYLGESDLLSSVEIVQDLLSDRVWPQIVAENSLDGVSHLVVDAESRDNWFRAVQAKLSTKAPAVTSFPPSDLHYLCTLVSGVTGTGLPYVRGAQQIEFISDPDPRILAVYTHKQLNAYQSKWEEWEIAVACRLGRGPRPHSGGFTVYCRSRPKGLGWQWRYGMIDEDWCSEMYSSLEDFLAWYAYFGEQTAAEVRQDIRSL